jgi:hypothetical protein
MFDHIPEELKKLQQWVCFDVEEARKVPYTPGTDSMAASNRPRDWRSYRAALKDVESGKRQHLGFCFASTDPYVFIDLDDPDDEDQQRVLERIASYAQRSVGGHGVHVICKGNFNGSGKHPAFPAAGLFKENRFCLFTGDVVDGRSTINVVNDADLQSIHTWLGGGHGHAEVELVEYKSQIPDQTVFDMGCDRFLKFSELCCGRWEQFEEFHNDHSTADHAFIAMLCDLTESNDQVRWFFGHSGMWNEERAAKKAGHGFDGYVNRTIRKIRSSQAREEARNKRIQLDFSEETTTDVVDVIPAKGNDNLIESLPDGLVKDMARYSFSTSYLPLQEASLLASLMLMSGIAGRGFLTPTKSGLNLWLVLVGGTSCGKDEYQNGMKRLITAVSKKNPSIRRIFGGEIVSGPGLETVFQDTFRYISYIPEFGDTFKNLANPNAQEYTKTLSRGLLNSFNSAGQGGSSEGRRKANSSDEKVCIERPCLSLAGEATPESLYGSMTTRELATGFLQRFILLDVPLSSWSLEENPRHGAKPPQELVERLEQLALMMDTADATGHYDSVASSKEASEILRDYRNTKRAEIMACSEGLAKKEVINRAGLKVVRIATLLAVSADFHTPLIRKEHALWAIRFVEQTDAAILARFDTGEVGSGQVKQELEILKACKTISKLPHADRLKMGFNRKTAPEANLIPLHVLKKFVINNSSFASDRLGAVTAFEKAVESLCKSGVFSKVSPDVAVDSFLTLRGVLLSVDLKRLK